MTEQKTKTRKPRGNARETTAEQTTVKSTSKISLVLAMLHGKAGASLDELVAATGWLPHTTRAALTGIKKQGHALSSEKVDGVRTYRIIASGGVA